MDLKSYLIILEQHLWVIIVTLLVTMSVAIGFTLMTTPIYTATTTLRIATSSSGVVGYSDYMYADRLLNTFTRLATSRPVLSELSGVTKVYPVPPLTVVIVPNTELIKISVDHPSPVRRSECCRHPGGAHDRQGERII